MSSNLQTMLSRVREGSITFAEFVAGTRDEFHRMALYLMRKWTSPIWFSVDDCEQELYLGAWKYIWRYEPCLSNGASLARYTVFNSMALAKTQLHLARGVTISGSPDRKVSHIETPLTVFGDDGEGEALLESILQESPQAEEDLIDSQERKIAASKALKACTSKPERFAVLAIRESGSIDNAGRLLYDDFDHRIELRLGSEEQAERFVFRHAKAVAKRIAQISVS